MPENPELRPAPIEQSRATFGDTTQITQGIGALGAEIVQNRVDNITGDFRSTLEDIVDQNVEEALTADDDLTAQEQGALQGIQGTLARLRRVMDTGNANARAKAELQIKQETEKVRNRFPKLRSLIDQEAADVVRTSTDLDLLSAISAANAGTKAQAEDQYKRILDFAYKKVEDGGLGINPAILPDTAQFMNAYSERSGTNARLQSLAEYGAVLEANQRVNGPEVIRAVSSNLFGRGGLVSGLSGQVDTIFNKMRRIQQGGPGASAEYVASGERDQDIAALRGLLGELTIGSIVGSNVADINSSDQSRISSMLEAARRPIEAMVQQLGDSNFNTDAIQLDRELHKYDVLNSMPRECQDAIILANEAAPILNLIASNPTGQDQDVRAQIIGNLGRIFAYDLPNRHITDPAQRIAKVSQADTFGVSEKDRSLAVAQGFQADRPDRVALVEQTKALARVMQGSLASELSDANKRVLTDRLGVLLDKYEKTISPEAELTEGLMDIVGSKAVQATVESDPNLGRFIGVRVRDALVDPQVEALGNRWESTLSSPAVFASGGVPVSSGKAVRDTIIVDGSNFLDGGGLRVRLRPGVDASLVAAQQISPLVDRLNKTVDASRFALKMELGREPSTTEVFDSLPPHMLNDLGIYRPSE